MLLKQVTAAVIKQDGKILIGQRARDDECALLWEFPGGKREEGESLEDCVIREIREELNLDVIPTSVFSTSLYRFRDKACYFTVYRVRITGGELQKNVHEALRWIDPDELLDFDYMPADRLFAERLYASEQREKKMAVHNVLEAPFSPAADGKERVDLLARERWGRVERIVSTGQASPEGFWYDQQEDEWVAVLQGEAVLRFLSKAVRLKPGDSLLIPAHEKHRVESTSSEPPCIWLCFFASV